MPCDVESEGIDGVGASAAAGLPHPGFHSPSDISASPRKRGRTKTTVVRDDAPAAATPAAVSAMSAAAAAAAAAAAEAVLNDKKLVVLKNILTSSEGADAEGRALYAAEGGYDVLVATLVDMGFASGEVLSAIINDAGDYSNGDSFFQFMFNSRFEFVVG